MRDLIAKDVRLVVQYLWLIVPAYVLWCAQAFLVPEMYFWANLAVALAWPAAILLIEWQLDTDRFVASLPVSRADIVKARYLSALGGLALAAVLFVAFAHGMATVASDRVMARWNGSPSWASADGVAALFVAGYLLLATFLPCCFRFGLPLGASFFGVLAAVGFIAATVLARVAGHTWAAGLPPSAVVRTWIAAPAASWGIPLATLVLLAGGIAIGAMSMFVSVRFYERREL